MTTALCPHRAASPASGAKIFGLALVSGMAPGFLLGLWAIFAQPLSGGVRLVLPLLTALTGAILGAPFSLLAFAPLVILSGRYWRLSWPHLTLIGFLSVWVVVAVLQPFFGAWDSIGGLDGAISFALCGAVAGFAFWLMVGDIDARSGSNDKGQSR